MNQTNSLTITLKPSANNKIRVEFDADRFERLAANLGLFSDEFLASVERAEQEIAQGKARRLRGLKDLRRRS